MRSDQPAASRDAASRDAVPPGDMAIDCGRCLARPVACGDCIVTVLLGPVGGVNDEERTAFAVLAGSGLVPPLRLVQSDEGVA